MIFNMVGGAGGGQTEGLYSWAKSKKTLIYPTVYSAVGMNNTTVDGVFNLVATSGDGWGKHHMYSESFSLQNTEFEVEYVPNTLQATWFIGFAETAQAQYANITHSLMFESGRLIRYNGATSLGQIGTFAAGDIITIKVKGSTILVYKAGALLTSFSHSLNTLVLNLTFYQGGKNYGTLKYTTTTTTSYGFVVDDDPNAYPNGGIGEGRFYYDSVSKVEMKLASGTAGGNTVTVTGLAFKPQAIYMIGSFYAMQTYYCWANAMFSGDQLLSTNSGYSAGSMSINSASVTADGFSIATNANANTGWTWYALGY